MAGEKTSKKEKKKKEKGKERGKERKKERKWEKRQKRRGGEEETPSNRPAGRGNDSLLSILDLSHFYSHPHEPRDYAFSFQFTRVFSSIVSRSSYHLQLRRKTFRRNGNEYPRYNAEHVDNEINFGKLFVFREISRKRYFRLSLDFPLSFISRVPYSPTNNISIISV